MEVHPFLLKVIPRGPMEFDLPYEATRTGTLELSWYREPGLGGLGAGHEISEIWIIKTVNFLHIGSAGAK